ncbi:RNA polymerase sigma factor [Pseudoflavonifractor phocaeensis]|uniref:RNA polymerase sigma factor n=1 Tax=Pseudoflavonifractor phocaeensis TaxID=1870988 RepID=UPI001958C054|nr:sigma-70 family RNA polymerase sigma factor [Pseudoflavonifractor phocaeensis]MBM6887731.1 sigma-70 family RNA polymerase sigma factor [Pseudoflavonifractor phocaeensis]
MGEETGLRQVMERYGDMVYRLALAQTHSSHDADDVFQEVFLRYLRAAPAFREEEHRKAWLLRVTVNCCKKLHGSFWRRHTVALSETLPAQNPEEGELLGLLEGLPPKYRAVLHLYYYEGYATEEIAAILGRSPGTVRSQLSRGRALLRDAWKGAEEL